METVIQFGLGHCCSFYPSRLNFLPMNIPPICSCMALYISSTSRPRSHKDGTTSQTERAFSCPHSSHTQGRACKWTLEETKCLFPVEHLHVILFSTYLCFEKKKNIIGLIQTATNLFIFTSLYMSEKKIAYDCFPSVSVSWTLLFFSLIYYGWRRSIWNTGSGMRSDSACLTQMTDFYAGAENRWTYSNCLVAKCLGMYVPWQRERMKAEETVVAESLAV